VRDAEADRGTERGLRGQVHPSVIQRRAQRLIKARRGRRSQFLHPGVFALHFFCTRSALVTGKDRPRRAGRQRKRPPRSPAHNRQDTMVGVGVENLRSHARKNYSTTHGRRHEDADTQGLLAPAFVLFSEISDHGDRSSAISDFRDRSQLSL